MHTPKINNLLYWSTYPLDRIRRFLLFRFRRILSPLMARRSLRICLTASFAIPCILLFSWCAPLWQLLLGPIVLGIPHLVGDVRYLVLQKNLHKKLWFWWGTILPFGLYVCFQQPYLAMIGVCTCAIYTQHHQHLWIKSIALLGLFLSYLEPYLFIFSLLHLHNIIALWIWWKWRKNRSLWECTPIVLCILALFVLCLFGPAPFAFSIFPPELPYAYFSRNIVPISLEAYSHELILSYAFLQSMHYLVWIRLIPEEARQQPSPRSFYKSAQYLLRDFGKIMFAGILLSMLILFIGALYSPKQARFGYLTLISFHGFLELAFLCYHRDKL